MQKQEREMELGLSLGDASNPFGFMEIKARQLTTTTTTATEGSLGFCVGLSIGPSRSGDEEKEEDQHKNKHSHHDHNSTTDTPAAAPIQVSNIEKIAASIATDPPPVQLDLLPNTPVNIARGFGVNRGFPAVLLDEERDNNQNGSTTTAAAALSMSSSPPNSNSGASSFQMDFCIYSSKGISGSNELLADGDQPDRASSRASDEDENDCSRKKLRLSKQQSAFLEESFKEHNTLNPKQKLALAKQLNLRPRQVEVWFQNRRARTKLKQTEVDCEYLKRCCETLTEDNRRLHKELQELRALKTSNPFYTQLPATTLTMCPSCERVATTTSSATPTTNINNSSTEAVATSKPSSGTGLSLNRARFYPFSGTQTHPNHHQPTSS